MSDLCEATAEEMAEVERTLAATGAGSFHLRQIRDALSALRSESGQRDGAAGSSGATTMAPTTTGAVAVAGGRIVQPWITQKRYAAFLSHHQRDSATFLWIDTVFPFRFSVLFSRFCERFWSCLLVRKMR